VQPGERAFAKGGSGFEVYLSLSQRVNLAGLSKRRRESLERELAHDAAARATLRVAVRRGIAELWLARWSAQAALAVAARERALADELAARVETMLAAGEGTVLEQSAARTWGAEAEISALFFEGEALTAGTTLARAMGQAPTAPLAVSDALPQIELGEESSLRALLVDVSSAPAVVSAASQRQVDSSRLAETAAARGATMALGALGWREGGGDLALVGTLEVDVPVFERGERERATVAAELARSRGTELDSMLAAQAERVLWLHDVEHSREVLAVVVDKLLPAAHAVADAQYRRMQAREATAQEWVLARRAVLKSELDAIRARATHALARFLVAEAVAQQSQQTRAAQ
jgi:outer membrane protein TolC